MINPAFICGRPVGIILLRATPHSGLNLEHSGSDERAMWEIGERGMGDSGGNGEIWNRRRNVCEAANSSSRSSKVNKADGFETASLFPLHLPEKPENKKNGGWKTLPINILIEDC